MDKATRPITMLTIRDLLRLKDKRLKVKGWKKIFHENGNKKAGRAILILRCSNSISKYLSKETQNTKSKGHIHPYVYCSSIYNSQDMEAIQVSINRQTDKEEMVHI